MFLGIRKLPLDFIFINVGGLYGGLNNCKCYDMMMFLHVTKGKEM